jgi:hypothetical protein
MQWLPAGPLVTTWPCFTEAMYLVFQAGGYPAQAELWRWRTAGRLALHNLTSDETDRIAALMDKYRDHIDQLMPFCPLNMRVRQLCKMAHDGRVFWGVVFRIFVYRSNHSQFNLCGSDSPQLAAGLFILSSLSISIIRCF